MLRWALGIVVGGGAAGLVRGGTALLRAGPTATTGGRANPVVAILENLLAVGGTALALLLLAAGLALGRRLFIASRERRWQRRRGARHRPVPLAGEAPLPPGFA